MTQAAILTSLSKTVVILLSLLLPPVSFAADSWLSEPPFSCIENIDGQQISPSDVFELPKSKFSTAQYRLRDQQAIELHEDLAKYFLNEHYIQPKGKSPFLVRAVFGHGGTGLFNVYRCGQDLYIAHSSLGKSWVNNRSALIVNLDFSPSNIYIKVMIAE